MRKKTILTKTLLLFVMMGMLLLNQGCSSTGKIVGLGAASGAAIGTGIGLAADPGEEGKYRIRNLVIGSAIGGALGAGAGFLGSRIFGKNEEENKIQIKKEFEPFQPELLPARTEAKWIPDQIRGKTFIPGHFEYVITEGAKWQNNY